MINAKSESMNFLSFITENNEFITRLKEFHIQFKNLGVNFGIDSYKDLFKILKTVDWTDFSLFRAAFQFIFIKEPELIEIFNKIFSTIFLHGDFLEDSEELKNTEDEFEKFIQQLSEYIDHENNAIKNDIDKNETKLDDSKNLRDLAPEKEDLFLEIEKLLQYDNGSLNSIFKQYYINPIAKEDQDFNQDNNQDSSQKAFNSIKAGKKSKKNSNKSSKKNLNHKSNESSNKTSNENSSKNSNKNLAFKLKHYDEFFNQYKKNLQDLNAKIQTHRNIGYDLKETYKKFISSSKSTTSTKNKKTKSNSSSTPSEIINSLFLKKADGLHLTDKEIFDRWFHLSRKNFVNNKEIRDLSKELDEFDNIFLNSSPIEFLDACGKYIKIKKLLPNSVQDTFNLDVYSEYINKKKKNKAVNNDKKSSGNTQENEDLFVDISSVKSLKKNTDQKSSKESINSNFYFNEIKKRIQGTLRKLVDNNTDLLIFHDALTRAYFYSNIFPHFEKFFEENSDLLTKTSEKLLKDKETEINSSIRDYISSKYSKRNKSSDTKELELIAYKIGNKLASREGSRFSRNKRGKINFRALFRKNIKNFNIPIDLTFKKRKITKPKLVLLCDVSYSMDEYMRFYLKFFYCLERCFSNIETFAFIDSIIDVSPYFERLPFDQAFDDFMKLDIMDQWRKSDFGSAFSEFYRKFGNKIDSRTVFIIAGDARSNYRDGKTSIFYNLSKKAYRTIWLNPESDDSWDNGDSMISFYKSACDYLYKCSDPEDLLQITKANIFQIDDGQKRQISRPKLSQKYKINQPKPRYFRPRSYYNKRDFDIFDDYGNDFDGNDDFYY